MDSRDEPLAGRSTGETAGDLDRIPLEGGTVKVQDPVETEDWPSSRVADLVGWMVRRSETRKARETAMTEGAFDGGEHSPQFLALVDVAVDLSRFEAEGPTPDPESLDLGGTVEAAYRSLAGTVPGSLVLRIGNDVPPDVYADPGQLERLLAALIAISTPLDRGTATRISVRLGTNAPARVDGATVLDFKIETAMGEDGSPIGDPVPAAVRNLGIALCTALVSRMGGELAADPLSAGEGGFRLALPAGARRAGAPR